MIYDRDDVLRKKRIRHSYLLIEPPERSEPPDNVFFDGMGKAIRACLSAAVSEACNPRNPSPTATEFLDEFLPDWRDIYAEQYSRVASIQPVKPPAEKIVDLFWQGYKPRRISKLLNISTQTVQRYLDERGIPHRRKTNASRETQFQKC